MVTIIVKMRLLNQGQHIEPMEQYYGHFSLAVGAGLNQTALRQSGGGSVRHNDAIGKTMKNLGIILAVVSLSIVSSCLAAQSIEDTRAAAKQGDSKAQFELGVLYDDSRGVPQDYVQAAAWWRKAADQGHADAQYNLGVSYYLGEGVPQDYAQTDAWLRKAAAQGQAEAQNYLRSVDGKKTP